MFFLKELEHTITLEPRFLGAQLRDHIRLQLYRQVEGSCNGRFGYVVALVSISHIESGIVQDSFGSVAFKVRYMALLLKPFKNETVDAVISTVNKMGFFAALGPLQIFVSNHLIPDDYRFEPNSTPPCYLSEEQRISPGDGVRLKIVGTRIDATEMFAIGTIKEDDLGVLS